MALRPLLGRIWAQTGKRTDPGRDKYLQGWTAEIPTYEVLNFLQYQIDLALLAQTERGAPEWGADIAYYKGALAWDDTDNKVYIAKVANPNRNLKPSANLSQWDPSAIQVTVKDFEAQEERFNDHIARIDNPHKVTAQQAGTYTRSQIDTKVAAIQENTDDHKANKSNPHETTASQIGAVPITGGEYRGDVTFSTEETKINPGAGDHAVRADPGFFGLRFENYRLGIQKSSGRAILQNGSSVDFLMNEDEYVEKRKTVEPDYAVPTPDVWIDTLSDIHLKQGVGFTEFLRPSSANYTDKSGKPQTAAVDMPRHTAGGLALNGGLTERLTLDAPNNTAGMQHGTHFVEGVWYGATVDTWVMHDSSGRRDRVYISPNGQIKVQYEDSAGQIFTLTAGTAVNGEVFKLAITFNDTTTWAYLNGVLGGTMSLSFAPSPTYAKVYFGRTSAVPNDYWEMRQFKSWSKVLTLEQISTL